MKKLLRLTSVGVLSLTLAGCGLTDRLTEKATEKVTEKVLESATNSDVDLKNGEVSVTTEDGSVSFGEDLDLPDGFPSDVPVYSQAKVVSSMAYEEGYSVSLTSKDDFKTIKDYYKSEIEKAGWTIDQTSELNVGGKTVTYLCSQGERNLTVGVYAYEEAEEVTITLIIE